LIGRAELSPQDLDDIDAFKFRMVANLSRTAFGQMRKAFRRRLDIHSLYVVTHKMAMLSRVMPQWEDCCPNSCVAYTKKYKELQECPVCGEPRFRLGTIRRSRRVFCYIPLIPRLKALYAHPESIKELQYRMNYRSDGSISDVFDGEHYQRLLRTLVTIDGRQLNHYYFSDPRDIAFYICLDSYLLYKWNRSGPSAMPIVLQLYSLPPQICTHLARLICLGVIPGPKAPKELDSFLAPFEDECAALAAGVAAVDYLAQEEFKLHAYNLFPLGDIIAIEKMLNIKGHNGITPCRSCSIQAVRNVTGGEKTYYVPLMQPGGENTWDPTDLPLRQHSQWAETTCQIQAAPTKKMKNEIAVESGIKGMPALGHVGSIDYARGVPWDFMHLLFENVVPNLVHLWMGRFKGLDEGVEDFILSKKIWDQIGEETVAAVKNIPSAFVRSLKNISNNQSNYTAESWAFWFMFVGPILLHGRLLARYHTHYCDLVGIIKTCIEFSLKRDDIEHLHQRIVKWVEEYEM